MDQEKGKEMTQLYQWRVYLTLQTSHSQVPVVSVTIPCVWVEAFKSEASATRFAAGGLLGPIKDTLGIEHVWSLQYLVKIEVEPVQQEPRGAAA